MNTAKAIKEGYWSNSMMNGAVLNVNGLCRTVVCGTHCGCSPVIMEVKYGNRKNYNSRETPYQEDR